MEVGQLESAAAESLDDLLLVCLAGKAVVTGQMNTGIIQVPHFRESVINTE